MFQLSRARSSSRTDAIAVQCAFENVDKKSAEANALSNMPLPPVAPVGVKALPLIATEGAGGGSSPDLHSAPLTSADAISSILDASSCSLSLPFWSKASATALRRSLMIENSGTKNTGRAVDRKLAEVELRISLPYTTFSRAFSPSLSSSQSGPRTRRTGI
jgi:hypothetical protein